MPSHERIRHNLLAAIRRVLRSLARIAIKNGVMHTDFSQEVRAAYLEAAREAANASGRPASDMRLRLITGLSPSDVSQWRDTKKASATDERETHNLAARVLSAWHSEASYTFAYGLPVELPAQAANDRPSIAKLVSKFDETADPMVIIEQLLDAGCIREVGHLRYTVVSRVYMPSSLSVDSIRYFADAVERFIQTQEHNLYSTHEKLLERAVFADHGIPEHRLDDFKEFVKDQWSKFADPIDDYMNSPLGVGREPGSVIHTGVGVYHYVSTKPMGTDPLEDYEDIREGS